MSKKNSKKTLIIFWAIAIPLLVGWYFFLQWKDNPTEMVNVAYNTSRVLPLGEKYDTALELAHYALQKDDVERTFLVLLQNNMELRPGGGYIGSFAIVKVKNGEVTDIAVHDTSNFDGRIPDEIAPPFPMKETLNIPSWKLRDSNWMPDFPTNARVAEKFYKLGGGGEEFDGVIAVNATVFDKILDIVGPITLPQYGVTFTDGDAIMTLEHYVERGYKEKNIKKGDRKVIMNDLGKEIVQRIKDLPLREKLLLATQFTDILDNKDIQLYFDDDKMSTLVDAVNWGGEVDTRWDNDYLMVVDANLASYKTDPFVKRDIDYDIDLSGSIPQAVLTLHYENTAKQKNWNTNDYQTYVRVYAPGNTWFTDISNCVTKPQYGEKYGKKYVGCLVHVPLGTQKDIVVRYNLPIDMKNVYPYNLKIQKQSGVYNVPVHVSVVETDNADVKEYSFLLNKDITLSDLDA